jgi:hypothetical protein
MAQTSQTLPQAAETVKKCQQIIETIRLFVHAANVIQRIPQATQNVVKGHKWYHKKIKNSCK